MAKFIRDIGNCEILEGGQCKERKKNEEEEGERRGKKNKKKFCLKISPMGLVL